MAGLTPLDILQRYWRHNAFRPLQEEIIRSVIEGKDTLALLPTGGGKSVCFQVPALCLEGICLVVSPLIALMKDQVQQLKNKDIKAAAIYSGMSRREIDITLDNCIYGDFKFLYVSPERLKTELFLERAKQMKISLLAIDEAHCISQWGYDFRPPYLELSTFIKELNIERIIALTATATREVKADIIEKLEMKDCQVFQKSFVRDNLSYSAFKLENKEQKLLEILGRVGGSGVVYVRSRKRTKEISDFLVRAGITSNFYHAGLSGKIRDEKQNAWINNRVQIMVATNAFGMGIDKPDVRTVVHMDLPDSLEAYYQEAGRAGRDEKKAFAVALYNQQDESELKERAEKSVVSLEELKRTYQALANYYKLAIGSHSFSSFDFNFEQFTQTYKLPAFSTFTALKKLSDEGLIQLNDGFYEQSRISFLLEKPEVYKYQVANPKLDPLIKNLLRLYGGEVFVNYSTIREKELATMLKTDAMQVKKWLQFLHDQQVIDYQAATDSQRLTFLLPRQDAGNLPIDNNQIEWRRKLAVKKAQAVIDYVSSKDCRTNVFQSYFDEEPEKVCGICDNDLNTKKQVKKFPQKELIQGLQSGAETVVALKAKLSGWSEAQILESLRQLMEDNKVEEENGKFSLR
ncbi:MAG: ATP-dependent DNA helicase RecQ [Cyclobacteriaceae bacterium]